MEYEIKITWQCEKEHANQVILSIAEDDDITTIDDVDDMVSNMVSDVSFIRENSCKICQNTTQEEVDWEINVIEKISKK